MQKWKMWAIEGMVTKKKMRETAKKWCKPQAHIYHAIPAFFYILCNITSIEYKANWVSIIFSINCNLLRAIINFLFISLLFSCTDSMPIL